jgi:hypothetical protein
MAEPVDARDFKSLGKPRAGSTPAVRTIRHLRLAARRVMFSIEFLQAVNDWQRGGDRDQVRRRCKRLAVLARDIDARFRQCDLACFRQVALEKGPLWNLLAEEDLPEKISSWTLDSAVVKTFKGGVPPEGWQGVIFALRPAPENVVLNLDRPYPRSRRQRGFSVERHSKSRW